VSGADLDDGSRKGRNNPAPAISGARLDQIAAAANAIMGLGDEWQEIKCTDPRNLDREFRNGIELRFYRRSTADDQR
jgi:hypothetical protein